MVVHILDDNIDHGQLYKPPKTLVFLIHFGWFRKKVGREPTMASRMKKPPWIRFPVDDP